MRKPIVILLLILVSACLAGLHAQKLFTQIDIGNNDGESIPCITQDHLGYIWFGKVGKGLIRYDGTKFITYTHDDRDTNSITGARPESIAVDTFNHIWMGTLGGGMDRFDPLTGGFKHFRHRATDPGSLSHDTVTAIFQDHLGNLWVGTSVGLDRYDPTTNTFIHYTHKFNDANSLSGTHVRAIYEDHEGTLWIGCGSPWPKEESWKDEGGLNRFDRTTGKFTRFVHNPNDPSSIANNKVRALLEDSKGNFWVGTAGDGLQTLNRQTGKFTHYYYDSTHPDKLSRGPLNRKYQEDQIEFIKEDAKGRIWIGVFLEGIVEYDPRTKKVTHHGYLTQGDEIIKADTLTGFDVGASWAACVTKDGLLFVATGFGQFFKVNDDKKAILPYAKADAGTCFYKAANGDLWVGGDRGILYKDGKTGNEKLLTLGRGDHNSLVPSLEYILPDKKGVLWIATWGAGIERVDPDKKTFLHYKYNSQNALLAKGKLESLYFDDGGKLWIAAWDEGVIKLDTATGKFIEFKHEVNNDSSLADNRIWFIRGNKTAVWVGTYYGLDKIDTASGKIDHYLRDNLIVNLLIDKRGVVWAGTSSGLYYYDAAKNNFVLFNDPNIKIGNIISLVADKNNNLWISTSNAILKISNDRRNVRIYNSDNGVHLNKWTENADYVSEDNEVFIGHPSGYYHFYPDSIKDEVHPPYVNIEGLQINGKELRLADLDFLDKPLYSTGEIKLPNSKNSFSLAFSAPDFQTSGEKRIIYMLENYDNRWHETDAEKRAYFYNLPVGHYRLKVRAINAAGAWSEKTVSIVITPPWWQTWWAIAIFIVALIAIVFGVSHYRSYQLQKENKLLEEKVKQRTAQLQESLENLKATQTQLIQSEKMASLGELTAGIAHEIQNPLNFVNNFSEVNGELIEELKQDAKANNLSGVLQLADEIKNNQQKINYHGKRADAIVKGMLQHARVSTGEKQPTDINALADEYLRLSYQAMRSKDKSFTATIDTHFDNTIGKISIIPQDMGRVLLNLFNNAFYAVQEKKKHLNGTFEPVVSVSTKKLNDKIQVVVKDNGTGIPQNIVEKIFQPFFTTKPTGEGTGLGLSLSYDIITKGHGGELSVESKEGEGSVFRIHLPLE